MAEQVLETTGAFYMYFGFDDFPMEHLIDADGDQQDVAFVLGRVISDVVRKDELEEREIRETKIEKENPKAWVELVEFLFLKEGHNYNIQNEVMINIKENETMNVNSLFWKSFEIALIHAVQKRPKEFSDYLKDKSPTMFVNSPLNMLTKFMTTFMLFCNWDNACFNYCDIFVKQTNTFIQFLPDDIFVKLSAGIEENFDELNPQLAPLTAILLRAKLNGLWMKIWGFDRLLGSLEMYQAILPSMGMYASCHYEVGDYFKPCVFEYIDFDEEVKQCFLHARSEFGNRLNGGERNTVTIELYRRTSRALNFTYNATAITVERRFLAEVYN